MRQQLISWLVDDLAPEIRKSRDAEGTILKFASTKNLAPSLVQAIGQLYNTAKTIAFLEKAGSKSRGDSFPILDVDGMVGKYLEMPKEAGLREGTIDEWVLDNPDGVLSDLPACFEGVLTPAFKSEEVINTVPQSVKKAFAEQDNLKVSREFAEQFIFETREDMIKNANEIVRRLRTIPEYTFEEMEADVLALNGERIKPVMDKLAGFCQADGWKVARAKEASTNKLLDKHPTQLMELIVKIDDGMFRLQAAQDYLDKEAATSTQTRTRGATGLIDMPSEEEDVTFRDFGETPVKQRDVSKSKATDIDVPGELNKLLDKGLETREPVMKQLSKAFKGKNEFQEKVDTSMLNARHMAVLQNLMTNDEILADADPDRVTEMYNTIREAAPELASDINVMRVLLRTAVAHDGISPFDLKSLIETELSKQKVDYNQRLRKSMDYEGLQIKPQAKIQQ